GKAGLLKITGTYTQLSTGTMNVSIGGTTVGTQYSQLQITGAASLGGTLKAAEVSGFTPTIGQAFTILKAASVTGTFANSTIAINGTEHFNVTYTATNVVLTVAGGVAPTSSTQIASQTAIASQKQNVVVAKPPIAISGLRHRISVPAGSGKPVFVAGLIRDRGRSNAMIGRAWEVESLRTPRAVPVVSAWNRIAEKPALVSR